MIDAEAATKESHSQKPAPTKMPKRYVMMTLLLVAMLLCYVDRIIISLAAIEMQKQFGWLDSEKGLVLSIFFAGYLLMQVLGGLLSNRFGGRNIFMIAVLLWSLFTVLTPIAASISFGLLIFVRFMLGFGEGAAFPAAYNLIHGWMPVTERSRSIGLLSGIAAIGTIIALLITGKIIELFGWPSVFYVFGSLGLVWAFFWMAKIPSKGPLDEIQTDATVKRKIPWRLMLFHPAVVVLYFMGIGAASVSYMMASWLPSYLVDTFQMSTTMAGLYSILPWIAVFFVTYLGGLYADKQIEKGEAVIKVRKRMVFIGFALVIISLCSLTLAPSAFAAVSIVTLLFTGIAILVPGYSPVPGELMPRYGDILYGFIAAAGSFGSIVFVYFTGVLLDETGSYDAIFYIMAAACGFGAVLFLLFGKASSIDPDDGLAAQPVAE